MTASARCCTYDVKAQVGGKIAQLGARLIDATSKQMADMFFDRFTAEVADRSRPTAPTAAARAGWPASTRRRLGAGARRRSRRCMPARASERGRDPASWRLIPERAVRPAARRGHRHRALARHLRPDLQKLRLWLMTRPCRPASPRPPPAGGAAAISRTRRWRPRCTWRWRCAGRCSWKASPAPARPRSPRCWRPGSGRRLVRLQCYDGMDLSAAAYEWDHARQLMAIRLAEAAGEPDQERLGRDIFGREFLQARPLLSAIDPDLPPAVLLIDELDRADEPFEAFLLELLADFQITVPEFGTMRAGDAAGGGADHQPHARGARRDPPALPVSVGGLPRRRRASARSWPRRRRACRSGCRPQVVAFVQRLRGADLFKLPGVAETIDWAGGAAISRPARAGPGAVDETLGVLLKYQDDIAKIRGAEAARLIGAGPGGADARPPGADAAA